MMNIMFYYGTEIIIVRIEGHHVSFSNSGYGQSFTTIDGLRLDKVGAIREFPDLKDNPEWKVESIKRFKEKIKSMKDEMEISTYIINDLKKFGYVPVTIQKAGHRIERVE